MSTMTTRTKKLVTPTMAKAPAAHAPCLCGCNLIPAGKKARYLPGHDARHHAALKAAGQKVALITKASDREKAAAKRKANQAQADAAPDALTLCNSCELRPMVGPEHPGYEAGYCAECYADAVTNPGADAGETAEHVHAEP
jgi:hypothetical protein